MESSTLAHSPGTGEQPSSAFSSSSPLLRDTERWMLLGMIVDGMSTVFISNHTHVDPLIIAQLRETVVEKSGTFNSHHHLGGLRPIPSTSMIVETDADTKMSSATVPPHGGDFDVGSPSSTTTTTTAAPAADSLHHPHPHHQRALTTATAATQASSSGHTNNSDYFIGIYNPDAPEGRHCFSRPVQPPKTDNVQCESHRKADHCVELIPPDARTWKVDIPEMKGIVDAALQKAAIVHDHPLTDYYTKLQEQLVLQEQLFHIQAAKQCGEDTPTFSNASPRTSNRALILGTRLSLALNVFLLLIKIVAAIRTGSTAVLASLVDSVLDLCSGTIMVFVQLFHDRTSMELYPAGKHHFEPLGTLVFACAMFVSATKLLQECADEVSTIDTVTFHMDDTSLFILLLVIILKSVAAYFCFKYAGGSPMLIALASDHRNDIGSNAVAILGFVLAVHVSVWFDPILAFLMTLFILKVWGGQILDQLHALSGHTASEEYLNLLTVVARNHDFRVLQVDTVRAFTSGTGHIAEIDLVLPEDMPLKEAHDIGESLQSFLENTPCLEIDRAYVHLDTETEHDPKKHL